MYSNSQSPSGQDKGTKRGTAMTAQRQTLRKLVLCGMLAAIALILFEFLEIPAFFFPFWLKFDLSLVAVLLAGFAAGPLGGMAVAVVKDGLALLFTKTAGIGELADLLMSLALVVPAALCYRYRHTRKGAVVGMAIGTACMMVVGALANYYILWPAFTSSAGGAENMLQAANAANGAIHSLGGYIAYAVLPFNLIKGAMVSILTYFLYKRVSSLLRERKK